MEQFLSGEAGLLGLVAALLARVIFKDFLEIRASGKGSDRRGDTDEIIRILKRIDERGEADHELTKDLHEWHNTTDPTTGRKSWWPDLGLKTKIKEIHERVVNKKCEVDK